MGLGALTDGLAPTPPMGWNSWNRFGPFVSDQLVRETADALILQYGFRVPVITLDGVDRLEAPMTEGELRSLLA